MAKMTKKMIAEQEQEEFRGKLREILTLGQVVYTNLRYRSRSGMLHCISLHTKEADGIRDITYWAAKAMGDKISEEHGGIKAGGCGMDMGFHLVYNLGHALFRDGVPCTGESDGPNRCRSNAHTNGDQEYSKTKTHGDGGYAFYHQWL